MNKKLIFIISGVLVVIAVWLVIYIYFVSLHKRAGVSLFFPLAYKVKSYIPIPESRKHSGSEASEIQQSLNSISPTQSPYDHKIQTIETGVSADRLTSKIKRWKKEFPDLFRQYPELEEMLKNSKGEVTSQIIKSLLSYSGPPDIHRERDAQTSVKPPIEPDKKEQIAEAIGSLSDSNPEERISALQTLIDLQAKEAIPEIMRLLYDPDALVRVGVLYTLGKLGAKESIPETIRCLYDPNVKVRIEAIATLKVLKGKEAIPEIMRLLPDPDAEVRCSAIYHLRELQAKEAIPEIMRLLYDSDVMVRKEAVYTLGELQAKEAISQIRNLLSDSNEKVRKAAKEVLRKLEVK